LAYNQLRKAGYKSGGPKWQRLVERLADDPRSPGGMGWVILASNGGSQRYILRSGVNINDIAAAYGVYDHPPTLAQVAP